jgi:hypothetical protein
LTTTAAVTLVAGASSLGRLSSLDYFQAIKPASDDVYQLFPLRMSNPHSRAVLSAGYDRANPPRSSTFAPFILPISEVQKALLEDTEKKSDLTVVLINATASEVSDAAPGQEHITIHSGDRCQVKTLRNEADGGNFVDECIQNRLAQLILRGDSSELLAKPVLLGSPLLRELTKALAAKLLTPYPQLVGHNEEIRMS